ncbi:MAG: YceI family protein [Bacteroidota bacterium]
MNKLILLPGILAMAASPAVAQTAWKIDRSHSSVKFTVAHLVIAEVSGRFTDFDVSMTTQGDDLTGARIEAAVKTASVNTDDEKRDAHLRGDDFLNAEAFPAIRFRSTAVKKTGKDTYEITGDLTIRDVTRPVVLATRYAGSVKDPWGNTKAGYRASATINRFDYGVKWSSTLDTGGLVVGKDVEITLLLEFAKQ